MEFKAEQKYLLLSPRKIRPIVDVIRKLSPNKALEVLPFIKKRGSEYVIKVIKSAVANASQKGVDINNLVFKEIQINEGPRLKRGIAVSRGRWHPIKKRMSHIKIILATKEIAKTENKLKIEKKEVEKPLKKIIKNKKIKIVKSEIKRKVKK